jgi:ATPase subunit of ABC transporter with duplicated ATPase domains
MDRPGFLIAIVGPCAAGKSTLVAGLTARGVQARQIAQEHSYVPAMWQVLTKPDALVYLHASYLACTRRKNLNWSEREYHTQLGRLEHARQHCSLYVDTDPLDPGQVLEAVWEGLGLGQRRARTV